MPLQVRQLSSMSMRGGQPQPDRFVLRSNRYMSRNARQSQEQAAAFVQLVQHDDQAEQGPGGGPKALCNLLSATCYVHKIFVVAYMHQAWSLSSCRYQFAIEGMRGHAMLKAPLGSA